MHAKVLICDEAIVIGSNGFTGASPTNVECGVAVEEPANEQHQAEKDWFENVQCRGAADVGQRSAFARDAAAMSVPRSVCARGALRLTDVRSGAGARGALCKTGAPEGGCYLL